MEWEKTKSRFSSGLFGNKTADAAVSLNAASSPEEFIEVLQTYTVKYAFEACTFRIYVFDKNQNKSQYIVASLFDAVDSEIVALLRDIVVKCNAIKI